MASFSSSFSTSSASSHDSSRARRFHPLDLLNYRRRWQILSLVMPQYVSEATPIVVGGCGRSGTTLLSTMLNRHPDIACGPESTIFLKRVTDPCDIALRYGFPPHKMQELLRLSRSQAEFIDLFRLVCLAVSRKRAWAEKTPENVGRLRFLFRHFPRARFVHVVRDGRDVACSLRRQPWMKLSVDRGSLHALETCANYWLRRVGFGRSYHGDPRCIEIRYEDLVRDPEREMRRLLRELGQRWHPAVLDASHSADVPEKRPIYDNAVGRWRSEFSDREMDAVERRAGPMLMELGYAAA